MKMYEDTMGNLLTEDEAREEVMESMSWDDYASYIREAMTFDSFFDKVRKLPGFLDLFEEVFMEAEDKFFNENYTETDIEEEEA